MNNLKKKWQIGKDVIKYLSFAHLGYSGIIFVIYLILFLIMGRLEAPFPGFLNFSYSSAPIYMSIMGGITAYHYFPMYVQLGVTRKQSFIGNMIGAIGGAITLVLFTLLITVVIQLVLRVFNLTETDNLMLFERYVSISEDSTISEFLSGTTFVAGFSRWAITLVSYWLSMVINYTVGWMIGIGFYRGKSLSGIGSIILGILFLFVRDIFWEGSVLPFVPDINLEGNPILYWVVSLIVATVILGSLLWIIRTMTKKIPIKV